jgi:hypothetical protein
MWLRNAKTQNKGFIENETRKSYNTKKEHRFISYPNWHPMQVINLYYEFSLLHIFSLVLQPWMSAYIRKTDGVYISVPKND